MREVIILLLVGVAMLYFNEKNREKDKHLHGIVFWLGLFMIGWAILMLIVNF